MFAFDDDLLDGQPSRLSQRKDNVHQGHAGHTRQPLVCVIVFEISHLQSLLHRQGGGLCGPSTSMQTPAIDTIGRKHGMV